MPVPRQKFAALDTSFLLKLSAGEEHCEAVIDWFARINVYPVITGTVLQELLDVELKDPKIQNRERAHEAKQNIPIWGFVCIPSDDVSTAISKIIAGKLFEKQALPDDCHNDALVIAEAAYNDCKILITERKLLLDSVNFDTIRLVLFESDVSDLVTISAEFIAKYLERRRTATPSSPSAI